MPLRLLVPFLLATSLNSFAQTDTLVNDRFADRNRFKDISLLTLWGGNPNPTSTFDMGSLTDRHNLTYRSLVRSQASKAPQAGGCCDRPGFRTANAIDYLLPVFDRKRDTIVVQFDLFAEELTVGGEDGRTVITLVHDYPAGGPRFGDLDSISNPAPFGRPGYNFRIKPRTVQGTNSYGYMMYGGGRDIGGEFESTATTRLPGFSSTPGGFSPGQSGSPGGLRYPYGPCHTQRAPMIDSVEWTHYTWVVMPERLEVYRRSAIHSADSNVRIMFMEIPFRTRPDTAIIAQMNRAHGTTTDSLPLMYNWFNNFGAVRFYNRWGGEFGLANVVITKQGPAIPVRTQALAHGMRLRVHPQPATGQVFITGAAAGATAHIYTVDGRRVMSRVLKDEVLDIAGLRAGFYQIVVGRERVRLVVD